ncbi:MAG: glutathione S-transferase [Pseudomonadota bacterium]
MTYDLFVGNAAYSSWSLRVWLLFDRFGIPFRVHWVDFMKGSVNDQLPQLDTVRTVPAIQPPDSPPVAESLAVAEELASRHPDLGLWPEDPNHRAVARTLAAEMHAGFFALRESCPMNLYTSYSSFTPDAETETDIARIVEIWSWARRICPSEGPWLLGSYSIADAFFAPVAARIAGYGISVPESAQAYVDAHLSDPSFRRWRALALADGKLLAHYERTDNKAPWPGPVPLEAKAIGTGPSVNATCPYSGVPPTHFMESGGRIFGFCNAGCRDKTVADPEAWPQFMAIYQK